MRDYFIKGLLKNGIQLFRNLDFYTCFPVSQREANSFPRIERKETFLHILIPREFEAVEMGI